MGNRRRDRWLAWAQGTERQIYDRPSSVSRPTGRDFPKSLMVGQPISFVPTVHNMRGGPSRASVIDWSTSVLPDGLSIVGETASPTVTGTPTAAAATATFSLIASSLAGTAATTFRVPIKPEPTGVELLSGTGWAGGLSSVTLGDTSSEYYDTTAIARWDVVPSSLITSRTLIGVTAYHASGIDIVRAGVDGGAYLSATSATYDPVRQSWNYNFILDPSNFTPNKELDIRFEAIPYTGTSRMLKLPLATNSEVSSSWGASGNDVYIAPSAGATGYAVTGNDSTGNGTSSAPYLTFGKAGDKLVSDYGSASNGNILCYPGHYYWKTGKNTFATSSMGWVTIKPAFSHTLGDVTIQSGKSVTGENYGALTDLFSFEDIAFSYAPNDSPIMLETDPLGTKTGFAFNAENCTFTGPGQDVKMGGVNEFVQNFNEKYAHKCLFTLNKHAWNHGTLVNNCSATYIGSDVFGQTRLVKDCYVKENDRLTATTWHEDLYDLDGAQTWDNIIIENVEGFDCRAAGVVWYEDIGAGSNNYYRVENVAVVNTFYKRKPGSDGWQGIEWICNHVVYLHNGADLGSFQYRIPDAWASGICMVGNQHQKFMLVNLTGGSIPSVDWYNDIDFITSSNHYITPGPGLGSTYTPGVDVTTGDPGWTDPASDNYAPLGTSVLKNRVFPWYDGKLLVPFDILGNSRGAPHNGVSVGPYA